MKGLPASGKSTYARSLISGMNQVYKEKWKRINKDDLRAMLDNSKWSRSNEEFVLFIRDTIAVYALKKGISVIIDDTNFAPKHEERFRAMAKEYKAEFEIKDFSDVSPEECIKRDLARPNSVGSKVIMQMYNQYIKPKAEPIKKDPQLPLCIVCDLDGTLCLFKGNPYDRDFLKDELNYPVYDILDRFAQTGMPVLLFSGRSDKFEKQTIEWLEKYGVTYIELHMRKEGDIRKDNTIKEEMYNEFVKGKYNIEFVLDDRDQVVEFWRSQGLTCMQVAEGDF